MNEQFLAAGSNVEVGVHPEVELLGLTINIDTVIGTLIAAAITFGLGLFVRAKISSTKPNKVQLFFETVVGQAREQVQNFVGIKVAPYLITVAMAVFVFILTANWLSVLPIHHFLEPPTADVNLVYAMTAVLLVWWHAAGVRAQGGPGKYTMHILKGHAPAFAPMWIIEEIVHPVSLALRLFGNIFAGGIMVTLLLLLPPYITWLPVAGWKLFDMGIGLLQAFVFVLLTIAYFGMAMENRQEGHH